MWNEMVKDEEITFNGEESAHPGKPLTDYSIHFPRYVFLPPSVCGGLPQFYSLSTNDT